MAYQLRRDISIGLPPTSWTTGSAITFASFPTSMGNSRTTLAYENPVRAHQKSCLESVAAPLRQSHHHWCGVSRPHYCYVSPPALSRPGPAAGRTRGKRRSSKSTPIHRRSPVLRQVAVRPLGLRSLLLHAAPRARCRWRSSLDGGYPA